VDGVRVLVVNLVGRMIDGDVCVVSISGQRRVEETESESMILPRESNRAPR